MADIHALTAPKLKAPRDAFELPSFVGGYSCLLDVLLGADHGAAARIRQHATFWQQNAQALPSMLGGDQLPGFLMRIMRTIQLITIDYINDALKYGAEAALPDYTPIQDAMRRRTWQNLSQLPLRYLEAPVVPAGRPATALSLAIAAGLHTTPATATTAATAPAAASKAVRADAPKAHQNSEWVAKYAASGKDIASLKADEGRPKICFSYHLRGTCFEACREHSTHQALTAAEKASVQTFLDKSL